MNTQPTPALSQDELKWHVDFIYRRVMDNTILQSSAKFGVELKLSVQDIVHSNVTTLRKIGLQIEKVAKENGSSAFSTEGPFKINGVPAEHWITFLQLQIRLTQVAEETKSKAEKLRALKLQLEEFKTPGEKRTDIEQQIAALEGAPGVPTLPVQA